MGMKIGMGNANVQRIQLKKADGTVVATMSISKYQKKKRKRLNYNYREISNQLMQARTSDSAGRVLTNALGKVAMLLRKAKSGEYDDKELESAIIHAKKIERVARKRLKHLKEEENAKKQGVCWEDTEKNEECKIEDGEQTADSEISDEELRKMLHKLNELMKESMKEWNKETGLDEMTDELLGNVHTDMTPEELERLKKKHRADELREIAQADMKYLRDMFSRLEKEKQELANGVSLELGGMEMPVQMMEVPVVTEGISIDAAV